MRRCNGRRNRAALTAVVLTALTFASLSAPPAQARPDFSGTWRLDRARSDPPSKTPWGHRSADKLLIYQTADALTLSIDDDRFYQFVLDGVPHSYIDHSTGKMPHFVGLTVTQANLNATRLVLKITEVARITTPGSGVVHYHPGITRVHVLTLSGNGKALTMERTGYRHDPPALLHGSPYSRAEDLVYAHQTLVYNKSN